MYVRGDDCEEEEKAVEDDIGVEACEEHDCDGREDYVEDGYYGAFDNHGDILSWCRLGSGG